ncbi:TorD/DmsD family molecular chaperone [Corynebacterium renale]|uniref:TorA maturation chaperone TorD n=1 Tax=Corynebacterium renale TaxID=1724 RepID=A0A2A9DPM9_9CORY|nr:molecular chaperone TorD family protein [Corynebacterium renale]PFG28135.1 TorA maturation chaperone TorD [Corynebacterium renale]SQI20395.1 twin-arginine leader-binding protein [Corynebacterium renale]
MSASDLPDRFDEDTAQRIAAAGRVLSALYLGAPDEQLRAALQDPEMLEVWPLHDDLTDRGLALLKEAPASAADEAHDHLYLFTGIGRPLAVPYESPYFSYDHLVMDEDTFAVRDTYRKHGFAVPHDNIPDDHIGYEIAFITELAGQNKPGAPAVVQNFVEKHLGRFAHLVTDAMREHATSSTYRALADLTDGWLSHVKA